MIEAKGLTKHYGTKQPSTQLSFKVRPGVVTGFLGPNGSGKSTTMRMIMGLDAPERGDVTVNGQHFKTCTGHFARSAPSWRPRRSIRAAVPVRTFDARRRPTTSRLPESTNYSTSLGSPRSPASGPASSPWAWVNGSASPQRCSAIRRYFSSMNRSTASTPMVFVGCETS